MRVPGERPSSRIKSFSECYAECLRSSWKQALLAFGCTMLLVVSIGGQETLDGFPGLLVMVNGEAVVPDGVTPLGPSTITVNAEGHPVRIAIDAIDPIGTLLRVEECFDISTCAAVQNFNQCGIWSVVGTIEYAHEDPLGGGPYVNAVGAAVVVVQCDIFADDFESGDTSRWSQSLLHGIFADGFESGDTSRWSGVWR